MIEDQPKMADPLGSNACPCVGIIVRNQGKILMLERLKGVLGWACPAGHRDLGEFPTDCAKRELLEETDVDLDKSHGLRLVMHSKITNNACSRGASAHVWHVYFAEMPDAHFQLKEPTKHSAMGWFTPEEISEKNLEPVWRLILEEVGILKKVA